MRRLNLVLLASLQLCRARQPSFSIYDDVLAHPQFEVVFDDAFISETDALALLESSRAQSPSSQTDLARNAQESTDAKAGTSSSDNAGDDAESSSISETYELINSAPWRYLCSVPVLGPPPAQNQTANELAKAEEARELSRASARGWELMSGLEGHCLYFMDGWWSYSFCYGKAVVQFHAAASNNKIGGPPIKDENSQEYVLGVVREPQEPQDGAGAESAEKSVAPPNAQLQVKDDQRYLVQRLDGGTICDLTNRPRTIEIQYHCQPNIKGDRIGWIKEVTTCAYLMLVQTPRLCSDVAFQPPKPTRAHAINCRRVIASEEEESAWRYHQRVEAGEMLGKRGNVKPGEREDESAAGGRATNQFIGMTIGGVVVGGNKVLGGTTADGKAAFRLAPPRHLAAAAATAKAAPVVELLATEKKDGGKIEALSDDELRKLNLDPEVIHEWRDELQRLAGDRGWKLEVVQVPGEGYELVGAFDNEEGAQEGGGEEQQQQQQQQQQKQKQRGTVSQVKKGKQKENLVGGNGKGEKEAPRLEQEEEEQEGSEEVFFKEEL